jgi:signal transduction histidine kinase
MNMQAYPGMQVEELHAAFRMFTDATANLEREYKRLQIHARELRAELAVKNEELRESRQRERELQLKALRQGRLAAMGEMAATLAHEVRNPLGAMELFTRLLLEEVGDRSSARRLAEQVARGIADLNHLVTNILEYTRLPEPSLARIDVGSVIDEAVLIVEAQGAGVEVRREGGEGLRWMLDRGLLIQAFVNLLRNGAEAMRGEGEIVIEVSESRDMLRISITDSGPGIPAGNEEAIFAPFYTTKARGTGLGLAVSRAALIAHGGSLSAEACSSGARFVALLPSHADLRPGAAAADGADEWCPDAEDAASAPERVSDDDLTEEFPWIES